ncbi:MAG: hypothetical protein KDD37_05545 [Bdellovibrionales bacterium]|nr:hypothetical protein [Bdellovibrionales bacterium]
MSYIITPSEKARSNTNPQPIASYGSGEISSIRLLFKNIFGLPIPWLQFIYVIFFLCSTLLLEISSWIVLSFGLIYILIDTLGKKRELRWFFTGLELPAVLFFLTCLFSFSLAGNDPFSFFMYLRWLPFLFIFPYILHLFPGVNRYFYLLIYGGSAFVLYAIVQHFTGYSFPGTPEVALFKSFDQFNTYIAKGLFNSPLIFGLFFSFISGFIWTAYFYCLEERGRIHWAYLILGLAFLSACLFTYDLRVWTAAILSLILPVFFINKKHFFISIVLILLLGYAAFIFLDFFRTTVLQLESNFQVLRASMNAKNEVLFDSISNHILLGNGDFSTPARQILSQLPVADDTWMENNFLKILSTTGVLGLITYLFFVLQAFLLNLRLLREIPRTHKWHKIIVLGTFIMQINFHLVGLFYPSLFHPHLVQFYIFLLAIMAYFGDAYGRGIVPDDSSL